MTELLKWLLSPDSVLFATIPTLVLGLFLASLAVSSVGWFRLVYFISIGYGYSIAVMAFLTALVWDGPFWGRMTAVILMVYGIRLGTYLWLREFRASYRKEQQEIQKAYPGRSLVQKGAVWLGVSVLYVLMVSPMVFHLQAGAKADGGILAVAGTWIALAGLVLEAWADFQKSRLKKEAPHRFCSRGLYRWVRFPNYFGEMLVWTGVWLGGLPFCGEDIWRWGMAFLGWVLIILVMLGSARRLELSQDRRYAQDPAYQAYVRRTPVILPFVPLKTLRNLKVYLG